MSVSLSMFFKPLITLCLIASIGCTVANDRTGKQLVIAAASDMVKALPDLGQDFEGGTGIKVVPSFGPSGALAQQIANGAPFDVFLSSDRKFISQLTDGKHLV